MSHCGHEFGENQPVLMESLFSQDEVVDVRQTYFSIAVLSGFVSFKSLLHTAFNVSASVSRLRG